VGPSGTHLGGDPDRFHDLLVGGSGLRRQASVALDAVGALGDVRDRDGDELLRAPIERAVFEHGLAGGFECVIGLRREFLPLGGDLGGGLRVERIRHCDSPWWTSSSTNSNLMEMRAT